MTLFRAVAISIVCLLPSPAVGARIRVRKDRDAKLQEITNISTGQSSCDDLDVVPPIFGHDIGKLAADLCRGWPTFILGPFPIETVSKVVELLDVAFGPDGVLEDMKGIWNTRRNRRFCWRNESLRDIIPADSNERCRMNVSDVCYGQCPRGYKAGSLVGRFKPVCTSVCADTFHRVPCGFGCAHTHLACVQTIFDQVGAVTTQVASAMGAILGDPAIEVLVEKIVSIASFALEVLPKILLAVSKVKKWVGRGYKEVALFLVLFQFVAEVWPQGGREDIAEMHKQLAQLMKFILDLTGGDLSKIVDLSVIRDAILNHGDELLGAIEIVTKSFDYPKCGEMMRDTQFSIEDSGEQSVNGPWVKFYEVNERPRYVLATNQNMLMEYTQSRSAWRILSEKDWLGRRKTLYAADVNNTDFPQAGWVAEAGARPVPQLVPC